MVFVMCEDCGKICQFTGEVFSYCSKCHRRTWHVVVRDEAYKAREMSCYTRGGVRINESEV